MRNLWIYTLITLLSISCDDFVEDRLDDKHITILSPVNNTEINVGRLVFAWDAVAQAQHYKIQIASPSFVQASTLMLDTIFILDSIQQTSSFPYTLPKGSYEWRIRGENPSSATIYAYASFTINDTLNILSYFNLINLDENKIVNNSLPLQYTKW